MCIAGAGRTSALWCVKRIESAALCWASPLTLPSRNSFLCSLCPLWFIFLTTKGTKEHKEEPKDFSTRCAEHQRQQSNRPIPSPKA